MLDLKMLWFPGLKSGVYLKPGSISTTDSQVSCANLGHLTCFSA